MSKTMQKRGTMVVRADAGKELGIGHVMRCLALAQAWKQGGGDVLFACASTAPHVEQRLQAEGMMLAGITAVPGSLADVVATTQICRDAGATWLALDGFHFSPDYCDQVSPAVDRILLLDDHAERERYPADLVLNTNPYASSAMYPDAQSSPIILAGPRFALLRREFLDLGPDSARLPEKARRLLVTFGGTDPHNVTGKVIEVLRKWNEPNLEVAVVLGPGNAHRREVETVCRDLPGLSVVSNPSDMRKLITWADLAISAGGGTCYELAFLRVPMLLIIMAENHARTVEAYAERHAAISAGWFSSVSPQRLLELVGEMSANLDLRRQLVRNAREMVDGKGAERVISAMSAQAAGCGA